MEERESILEMLKRAVGNPMQKYAATPARQVPVVGELLAMAGLGYDAAKDPAIEAVDNYAEERFGRPLIRSTQPNLEADMAVPVQPTTPPVDDAALSDAINRMIAGEGVVTLTGNQASLSKDKSKGFSRAAEGSSKRARRNLAPPEEATMRDKLAGLNLEEDLAGLVDESQIASLLESRREQEGRARALETVGSQAVGRLEPENREMVEALLTAIEGDPAQGDALLEILEKTVLPALIGE